MARPLANDKQLPLKRLLIEAISCCDDRLIEVGHRAAGSRTDVGTIRVDGQFPPADKLLPLLIDHPIHDRAAFCPFGRLRRHKENTAAVEAPSWELRPKFLPGNPLEQFVWESCQHAGTVAGVVLAATAATVLHVLKHAVGIVDDLTGTLAFDVGDEADTARVVLVGGVVEAAGVGKSEGTRHGEIFGGVHSGLLRMGLQLVRDLINLIVWKVGGGLLGCEDRCCRQRLFDQCPRWRRLVRQCRQQQVRRQFGVAVFWGRQPCPGRDP